MNNRILITGGAGFIGSSLALKLIDKDYRVTIMDNLTPQIHGDDPINTSPLYQRIKNKGFVNFIYGSVTSKTDWLKALDGQDAVIHLAAETGTGQSMYEIRKYVEVNIGGTSILLDILANNKDHGIKKIIVASSRSIYGEGKYNCVICGIVFPGERDESEMLKGSFDCTCPKCGGIIQLLPTCEESKIHPSSVYGITKQNQEQLFLTVGRALNIPSVAFRYQNVYGPGQSLSNPYTGILSIFSTQIKNGSTINVFEDGKESRDFVFIDDVVNATILGLEKDEANFEIFNVGSDEPKSVIQIAKTLKMKYKADVTINITGNFRIGDIRHNFADLGKIKQRLGYKPEINFDTGITFFANWVNQQDIKEDNYKKSIEELKSRGLYK